MAILEILTNLNPILRKTSKPVAKITREIKELVQNMEETLRAAPGVGLAAPQVGELIRLIIADVGEGMHVIINPKILKKSGKQSFVEGCLSLPGLEAPIVRSESVLVKGMDLKGRQIEVQAEGLLATVFQHEIDHLDGKLFTDRVADPDLITYLPKDSHGRSKTPKEEAI
jgi:peptide deformylase